MRSAVGGIRRPADNDGFMAVVLAEDFEVTSAEGQAELQAIVDSIEIDVQ
jgi:hypothetical protein